MSWDEVLKLIAALLQAASIITAALFAIAGLDAWRRQMIGKRRMEIAEETISAFRKVRDGLHFIRSPFTFEGEGSTRKPEQGESPGLKEKRDQHYVTLERIRAEEKTLHELQRLTYIAGLYFGEEADAQFLTVKRAFDRLTVSARMLLQTASDRERRDPTHRRKWEADVWEGDENDTITGEINRAVETIERLCRPSLAAPKPIRVLRWLVPE